MLIMYYSAYVVQNAFLKVNSVPTACKKALLLCSLTLEMWHFFFCPQAAGPQGSLKEGAKGSLQKSFGILNEAKKLANDVKG